MIPSNADVVEVVSNITGETGSFTVDSDSLGKIMGVLTNLYSDPEMAVVREYATNALDSQIEAQENDPKYKWRPIEVTLPTRFDKEYKVRDFGIGMSPDDITDTYSKYGKSTKESSNSVTGMLGLGSKCALTYTNQFNITGYKNGVMTQAIITKDENDVPTFHILDTQKTTEPNGVEISIPVRDNNTFASKTSEFFKFWPAGKVLVNGVAPKIHDYEVVKTIQHTYVQGGQSYTGDVVIHLIPSEGGYYASYKQSYIVMGNVRYEVAMEHVPQALKDAGMGFIAYVPMGSVTFPPNREVLTYNKRTKELVEKIGNGLFEDILLEALSKITAKANFKDAWLAYERLPGYFKNHPLAVSFTYRGQTFPDYFQQDHGWLHWDYNGNGRVNYRKSVKADVVMNQGAIVVTGIPYDTNPTSYFKKKVAYYMEQNNLTGSVAILLDQDTADVWWGHMPRVTADFIKAIKLPKNAPAGPRVDVPFDYYVSGTAGMQHQAVKVPVAKGADLVYVSPQDLKETYRKSGADPQTLINFLGGDVVLVVLGKNRFDKFKREHPTARPLSAIVQERIDSYVKAATDSEYIVSQLKYGEKNFLEKVNHDELDDPELAELAKLVQTKNRSDNYEKAERLYNYARRAMVHSTLPAKKSVTNTVTKKYPLIEHVDSRKINHLVIYCNAVFAI